MSTPIPEELDAACLYYTVDKGIAGGAPGTDPVYVAKCDFVCTSVGAYQAGGGPHAQEIRDDIAKSASVYRVPPATRPCFCRRSITACLSCLATTGRNDDGDKD